MSSYHPRRTPLRTRRRHGPRAIGGRSIVAFLLIASFGILFAGCTPQSTDESAEEFAFTEEDVARFHELVMNGESSSSSGSAPHIMASGDASLAAQPIVLDLSQVDTFASIRNPDGEAENMYRVTNEFVNMRAAPNVTAEQLEQLKKGDAMIVLEFPTAAWAKVRLANGREGYLSTRYIAKVTSEEKLAGEKKKFEGQYFVNFGFLNIRKEPDADSEKIGELPGQAIVRPLSMDEVWARVPFEGKEGYVAVQYLKPFLPNFLVRQETYTLPVLHYDLTREGMETLLVQHIAALQEAGIHLETFADFSNLLLQQQERDVRLDPKTAILAISGITRENIKDVSDILRASKARATLFLQTNQLGISGITDQMLLTLAANGFDVQSAGHTGDDLRSLTNSQAELELRQSRQLLEEKTGKQVIAFLYPLGGVNGRVEDIAAKAGYLFGIGNEAKRDVDRSGLLHMPSFDILASMSSQDVVTIALGLPATPQEE